MFDLKSIQTLRKRIDIPLKQAIELLKQHQGNIQAAVDAFHEENLEHIRQATDEHDRAILIKEYNICRFDVTKTIERLNNRPVVLRVASKEPHDKIGFILWPEKKDGEYYKTAKRNDVFIPTPDFEYIKVAFDHVFPQIDPCTSHQEEAFYTLGSNHFDVPTSAKILEHISNLSYEDPLIMDFVHEVKDWLTDKLQYAEILVVYGNL